uniref:Neurobeachin n=1 Tax=Eptatretus burgeri TaxID=7764 RepID=A0A8C4X293_EPTBU
MAEQYASAAPRNIRTKFAVLAGLVRLGNVSNRDIVETVLNLLVGGEFDLEINFIIQEAEAVSCMVELLQHCDCTCQAEVWSMFTAILRKSMRNLQACTEVGLIELVLHRLLHADDMIADLLVDMLGVLASYSITVRELKLLFSMLHGKEGVWPNHAVKLLTVLTQMTQRQGPDAFFNFPGRTAAAIALPPIARWPYQNGFTFNTWFRMDPLNNINVDKDKPYLYCFRTSKGIGYSAHFVGNCLIVTSLKSKGKGFQHCVKFDFQPRKWYMVTIVHVYNRWRNSEIRCYVNGQLVSYGDMAWHVNANDTFDKCFLGSSETADANRVFCGQLGAVYVFSEALNPAQIFAIHQLGPSYKSTFKFKSESDMLLVEHHRQVLYDGKLANSLVFTYNPKATDAQLCLESSPRDNTSIFVHSPHALMLQDVKAIITYSIHSAIHSIGGIQVLFPLYGQLDFQQFNDDQIDTSVCGTLLAFLLDLLKSSVAMQEQMLASKGFLVIGYLLEKSSRAHITRTVLEHFLSFAKYLDGLPHGAPMLKQLCDHILFNSSIWIHTPAKVSLSFLCFFKYSRTQFIVYMCHVINRASDCFYPADGPRPNQKEVVSLRAFMLLFLKQLILKDRGVKEDELQSILNCLLTMHEDENLHDVLQLLVALMSEHPASMIPAFDQRGGIRVVYKLLASKSESIRVQALKVLGYFLKHLAHKRKVEIMHTHSLFALLGERMMLNTHTLTMTTYNTLFEILTEQVCTQVVHKQHPEPDSAVKIQNPMILKVVATLLKNATPSPELMDVRQVFLSDMIKLFNNSRENRRCLLQCSVWQDWMFSLGYVNPRSSEEQKVTEMVYSIFRILLYHAIKYEWGGWRVWVDTLSIAHSKYLAKMYEEYQRQEEANIKRGKKGNVSTISGLSATAHSGRDVSEIQEGVDADPVIAMARGDIEVDLEQVTPVEGRNFLADIESPVISVTVTGAPSPIDVPSALDSSARELQDFLGGGEDMTAEKVEAIEVKSEEVDLTPELAPTQMSLVIPVHSELETAKSIGEGIAEVPKEPSVRKQISKEEDISKETSGYSNTILGNSLVPGSILLNGRTCDDEKICATLVPDGPGLTLLEKEDSDPVSSLLATISPKAGSGLATIPGSSSGGDCMTEKQDGENEGDNGVTQPALTTDTQRRQFSPGPRTTMFRIPEFKWSPMHQRLLNDLLFALESDIHMWRSHTTKTIMDFVNSSENIIFVHNTIHLVSQMVDNIIIACGGILPLLSAATSPSMELDHIEPTQGMSVETAVGFIQRLMAMVDVLVLASSLNFGEIEAEKNMSSGGLLRQCLRLSKSRLEHRKVTRTLQKKKLTALNRKLLKSGKHICVDGGSLSSDTDTDRLLQDVDIGRLRAVVFRDMDDSKQAQFLALAVVYFISVLMVSKYRDILEPQRDLGRRGSHRSRDLRRDVNSPTSTGLWHCLMSSCIFLCDNASLVIIVALRNYLRVYFGRLLPTLSLDNPLPAPTAVESEDSPNQGEMPQLPTATGGRNVSVKDILRSLVATPQEASAPGSDGAVQGEAGGAAETRVVLPMQFHSFDRIGCHKKYKSADADIAIIMLSLLFSLPCNSITTKLERALEKVAPLLREIFVDFAQFLSRTLLGSHGQELLIEGLVCMKSSTSVVELVMLLCSQEWQNSIQKNAGLAFIELINEGRLLCHAMKDHIVRVANEAEFILNRQRAEDVHKHAEFESLCAQYAADRREEEKMCDHLIGASKHRDHVTANQLKQKIVNILTNKHGAWGNAASSRPPDYWRLDYWEDDLRRRRRFVRNPYGSSHFDVNFKAVTEHVGADEEAVKQARKTIRAQTLGTQNADSELMLEGEDDALSLMEEKELDNMAGPVVVSTPAQLVAPGVVAKGTLSITTNEMFFEVDEDEASFKKHEPQVLAYTEGLHGKWMFSEIRAVFSRRFLLQNTALEIFMANRTSVMFNFPEHATVKKVVYSLPRVGVGTSYGLPQARRISLGSPRQLFKSSNMTQRWQRREISNFEYLMFLNTIAGRTYNDLNQYPVFPWVLTNYESDELDLTLPNNFRDLSKPIGALNPKRAAFFVEHYETWDDEQIPPFHYGTHYSNANFTLSWLLRIEPFTTFFLNMQGGKFDHPDRAFSSVVRAWQNCQRDTSDVKELIPEFYYLPEMFVNSNGYNLGITTDGAPVVDVVLPPWAGSPEEFVRINRMALESEFVSCQLHQWVDLVFGYKQRGPEATRALNVFYYLTYEGSVSLEAISDLLLREAVESQIKNFGQTPSQLLIEPHPPRSSAMHLSPLMFKDQMQQDVIMVLKFPSNSPVTHVAANTLSHLAMPAVLTVTCSRLFAVNRWHNTLAPGYSIEQSHHLPIEMDPLIASNTGLHRRQITDLVDQSIQINAHCFVVTADNRYILASGFWDKSFRVYSTDSGKLTQVVFGHWDVVTCLARSESYIGGDCYIVSGSRDATLLLWYWSGRHHIIGDNPGDYPTPRAILTGHDCEVTAVAVCAELGLVISGAKEGPCLVHTITGDLLRALDGPESCLQPRLIAVSSEGHCVIHYKGGYFCNFSINGKLLAQMEIADCTRAMLLSSDGQYLVTGGENGIVEVWRACDLQQLYVYPGCDAGIRALDISHDQRYDSFIYSGCFV